jgi:hypothetical protein
VGAKVFHPDGQTDIHDEANSCKNFANAPRKKKGKNSYISNLRKLKSDYENKI